MYKIRKITFQNNPVLGDLSIDFCGINGKAADTVIIAGENGAGKSTVLNELFKVVSHNVSTPLLVELEDGEKVFSISYYLRIRENKSPILYANDGLGMNTYMGSDDMKNRYHFYGIFSDVDINFHAQEVSTVTSLTLDSENKSRRSTTDLPTHIKQLIIDIQSLDDSEIARAVRNNPDTPRKDMHISERMPRFTNAFARMFDGLTYDRIENENGHKRIYFKKFGTDIPIDNLSSGEKQVVYRGCFLLKDVNATNGAFVFIDEPEISLHPSWQKKIMDYYKGIFTNDSGEQTSQIFAVTHSPFVIHNEDRKNDKVIILSRDDSGKVVVKDKPEYYKCNSVEAVQDAFSISDFAAEEPTVYLEGRTDEKYFNKALEVYGMEVPFQFKWIGYIDAKGEEANTGKDALNKAVPFLISRHLPIKNVCLFDCDTNKPQKEENNVITMSIPRCENDKGISIGIENALVFNDFDIEPYRKQRIEIDGYGIEKRIPDFQKMACCDAICSMNKDTLKEVLAHLKETIDYICSLYSEGEANDTTNQTPN